MFLKCKNRLADLKLPFGKRNSFTTYSPTWSKFKFSSNITEYPGAWQKSAIS